MRWFIALICSWMLTAGESAQATGPAHPEITFVTVNLYPPSLMRSPARKITLHSGHWQSYITVDGHDRRFRWLGEARLAHDPKSGYCYTLLGNMADEKVDASILFNFYRNGEVTLVWYDNKEKEATFFTPDPSEHPLKSWDDFVPPAFITKVEPVSVSGDQVVYKVRYNRLRARDKIQDGLRLEGMNFRFFQSQSEQAGREAFVIPEGEPADVSGKLIEYEGTLPIKTPSSFVKLFICEYNSQLLETDITSQVIDGLQRSAAPPATAPARTGKVAATPGRTDDLLEIKVPGTGLSFKMVHVEGGNFLYRDTYDKQVNDFYIGQIEVTQRLWKAVMKTNPSRDKGDDLPVNRVTYWQVVSFCKKLSALTGRKFRLPGDVEWEYAAKGGRYSQGYLYAGSDDPLEVGWFETNSQGRLHAGGLKKPNELRIYDMSGNVREMCDDFLGRWDRKEVADKTLPGWDRRARGGSWECDKIPVGGKQYDSYADYYQQGFGNRFVGFRLVME